MAIPFFDNNIAFFNINYQLCPNVNLTSIRNQIIKAISWIYKNAANFNADRHNIVLSGHSAGAHLVSLMLSVNWSNYGIDPCFLKGIALVSGIYAIEKVVNLEVNKEIGLSLTEAKKNNPFLKDLKVQVPTIISYREMEPYSWKKESLDF